MPRSIRALYVASRPGVDRPGRQNVRGMLLLRPGVPGVSDNIRVVSVVGRSWSTRASIGRPRRRAALLHRLGDLMPRRVLDTRVELLTPVEDPALRSELEDTLERCLADDTFAWELTTDGSGAAGRAGRARCTAS